MIHDIPKVVHLADNTTDGICELVKKHSVIKVREHLLSIMVTLNELQLAGFSHDRQRQIAFLKEFDSILKVSGQ